MDNQPRPSISQRSPFSRLFRWLFSWRGLRRMLIVLAWTATIIALLYGFENWRGARAWNKARRQLEARGEILDFKALIPQTIPPEQNFAATPFVQSWFPRANDSAKLWGDQFSRVSGKVPTTLTGNEEDRHFNDLVAWQTAFSALREDRFEQQSAKLRSGKLDRDSRAAAAPAVLEGLKASEDKLAELRAASQRPQSRYPVEYKLDDPWGVVLPHLAVIKAASQRLQLRASAKLALNHTDEAFADVQLILYLADSLQTEPFLISFLVRIACVQIATQPVWEGLAEHRWSDAQLRQLQTRLQPYNFFADLDLPADTERAMGILTADLLYKGRYRLSWLVGERSEHSLEAEVADVIVRLAPRGWWYQEQVTYSTYYTAQFTGTYDAAKRRIFPAELAARDKELQRECARRWFGPLSSIVQHNLLATLVLPSLTRIPVKAAKAQTAVDHALLACALERYRLANGQFPDKLQALMPGLLAQLPHDPLGDEPYKYRRTEDGQFILYSVGWNQRDDGGTSGKGLYDEKEGDWVWQYPAVVAQASGPAVSPNSVRQPGQ
jgi:hypothetical protein